MTKTQAIIEVLKRCGCKEVPRPGKRRTFGHPQLPGKFFFVGRSASLRFGRAISTSYSMRGNLEAIVTFLLKMDLKKGKVK